MSDNIELKESSWKLNTGIYEPILNRQDFSKGDEIMIMKCPLMWNSNLGSLKPLGVLKFPVLIKVVDVRGDGLVDTEGYGWSTEYLVKAGCKRLK